MLSNFKLASISSATGKPFKAFAALLRDKYFYLSLSTVLFLFLLWVLLTATGYADELFLPGPVKVWQSFISVSTEGYQGSTLVTHVFTSLYRILVAFLLSCIVGIPLGILMGASKAARSLLNPLIEFYRPLPPLGLYTLLVMWLGIGEESKLALLFLAGLPGMIIATIQAVEDVDESYLRVARGLGASKRTIILNVYLPAAGPTILAGMRISLGFVYTVLVAAEIVAATAGIGWMIWDASKFLLSDVVIMGLIVLGLTGVFLDLAMRFLGKLFMPWTRSSRFGTS
jgi:taurine transport system permease protein